MGEIGQNVAGGLAFSIVTLVFSVFGIIFSFPFHRKKEEQNDFIKRNFITPK